MTSPKHQDKKKKIPAEDKPKMGRTSKFNPQIVEAICSTIRGGFTQEQAARMNGIAEATFYEWKASKPEFAEALLKAWDEFERDNLSVIREASVNRYDNEGRLTRRGSWQASAWILERRMHEKYGMRWAGELTGAKGKPLIPENSKPPVDLSSFTVDQLKGLVGALGSTIHPPKSEEANGNGNGNGTHTPGQS